MAQTCTGDCLKCNFQQQTYCAAQRSYGIMKNQETIVALLNNIAEKLTALDAGQMINLLEDNTQKDSGVENREPVTL